VVARQHGEDLLVELLELLRGDVQDELVGAGRPLPGRRQPGPRLQPARGPVQVAVGEQPLQGAAGGERLGILRVVDSEAEAVAGQPPRPPPPGRAAGLLDEAELRQLAQVPRAAGGALADVLGGLGGRQRAVLAERLDQGEANGVGDGAQLARVGQVTRFESDVSKDTFLSPPRSSGDL